MNRASHQAENNSMREESITFIGIIYTYICMFIYIYDSISCFHLHLTFSVRMRLLNNVYYINMYINVYILVL